MTSPLALRVTGLGKRYLKVASKGTSVLDVFRVGREQSYFWALREVSFHAIRGDAIGIIGRNGAGKSTLLKIISRVTAPSEGKVEIYGRVNSLLEVGTGFQPDLSGRSNIFLNASILGMSRAETEAVFDEIVEFSGIGEFIDMPVKHYSSGMYSRLAFSIAAHVTGDVLAVDEVLSVGDAEFRRKCLERMNEMLGSRTVLFVSHSMDAILRFCNKALWIDRGRLRAAGATTDVVQDYLASVSEAKSAFFAPAIVDQHHADLRASAPAPAKTGAQSTGQAQRPQTWSREPAPPPSGQAARLVSVSLLDDQGNQREVFFRDERIHLEMGFDVLAPKQRLMNYFAVRCAPRKGVAEDIVVFSHHSRAAKLRPGAYIRAAVIPSHLLISGTFVVSVAILSPGSPQTVHHLLKRLLSFRVAERHDEQDVLGEHMRGVVLPSIDWGEIREQERTFNRVDTPS